jgi:maleate isomerase
MTPRRIGILIPSVNTVIEPEFYRIVPDGITVHAARLYLTEVDYEQWMKMFASLEGATRDLASARPDVIVFACTGASFANGPGWDAKVVDMMRKSAGDIPVVTTTTAITEALREFGARKLAIATPYPADADQRCRAFLEGSGFEVVHMQGLGIRDAARIGYLEPQSALEAGLRTLEAAPDAEALMILCANWRAAEIIDTLERRTGKPVVNSNQAALWAALRAIGHAAPVPGYGRLLRRLGAPAAAAV